MRAAVQAVARAVAGLRPADVALAAAVGVGGQLEVWFAPAGFSQIVGPSAVVAASYLVAAAALAWRRVAPLTVLLVVVLVQGGEFLLFGASEGLGTFLPVLLAYYSVGRYCPTRTFLLGSVLTGGYLVVHEARDPGFQFAGSTVVFWLVLLAGGLAGVAGRGRALEADQLRRDAQAREAAAAAQERARIIREMHDLVGHSLSLLVLQLVTAQEAHEHGDVAGTGQRLARMEATARDTLEETRRLMHVLDPAEPTTTAPQPGLGDIVDLVDSIRSSGVDVVLHWGDVPAVGAGLGLAAYRLVQEALTNVVKHARPPHGTTVTVDAPTGALLIDVRDHGATATPGKPGRGLLGMRQRVALYGGSLVAGPAPDGGFQVRALLPLTPEEP